ncbi:MAG TPA: choice-of-anchor L domain-containing protein [Thermoanaerobaculia bacterium]|jgi:hypothetical protein
MFRRAWVWIFAAFLSLPLQAITTKNLSQGLTAADVAGLLAGPGATISNVKITGAPTAVGSFAAAADLGVQTGVILSTGNVAGASGNNTAPDFGAALGTPGHPALDAIVDPFRTFDATVLEFDVVTVSPTFSIRYVFASEEYREFVGTEFNDVFAFFVDGSNIAITPGTNNPVTVNTINHLLNAGLYTDNGAGTAATQFDGFTHVLTAVAVVDPTISHHVRIAIADTSDPIYDSAVLIAQGGISGVALAPFIVPQAETIVLNNLENRDVPLRVFYATTATPADLSASGLPPDSKVTFTPFFLDANGQLTSTMNVAIGPNTPAGTYVTTIRSAAGSAESFATVTVIVNCAPPQILGVDQPLGQSVNSGSRATVTTKVQGSGPISYQWFIGMAGMTRTPIAGANGPTLQSPPVTGFTPVWVRATNPCGSVDSTTAFLTPR